MAMYYCEGCCRMVDDDWHPMEESELCPDCHAEKAERQEGRLYEISQQHAAWCVSKGLTQ